MADSEQDGISRRAVVTGAAVGVGFVPLAALTAQDHKMPSPPVTAIKRGLNPAQLKTLHAFLDRLCPTDEMGPGAVDMGASEFIDRAMGDWLYAEAPAFVDGLAAIEAYAQRAKGGAFPSLSIEVQDGVVGEMEAGTAAGFANSRNVFNRIRQLMLQGMFSDPVYGGNRNFAGWDLIAYPGAVLGAAPQMQVMGERLKPLHTSAYSKTGNEHDGH
jgi:gluconate 2-dehydrogenase gamma chain